MEEKKLNPWILVSLLLAFALGVTYLKKLPKPVVENNATNLITEGAGQTPTIEPTIDPELTVNNDFGISFSLADGFSNKTIGSKMYVYQNGTGETEGQWLEIFEKNEEDDLKTAIEKTILKEAPDSCQVEIKKDSAQIIDTAKIDFMDQTVCPEVYTQSNGISYFQELDKNRFLFFSIGQYAIPSKQDEAVPWQDTVKPLD